MDTPHGRATRFYGERAFRGLRASLVGVALAGVVLAAANPLRANGQSTGQSMGRSVGVASRGIRAGGVLTAVGGAQTAIGGAPTPIGGAQAGAADAPKSADTARVWTNADIEKLPDPGISLIGPEPVTGAEAAPNQEPYDRTKDPYWYADEATRLQIEQARRQAALQQYIEAIEDAKNRRNTESGIALDQRDAGITLQAGIENLQSQMREVQERLEELADLARRNGMAPGVVWGY